MQIKLIGGGSFYGPSGTMVSYGPNSVIDVEPVEIVKSLRVFAQPCQQQAQPERIVERRDRRRHR